MQVHVKDSGSQQFGSHESLVECFLLKYFFDDFIGDYFTGSIMLGIHFQHFRFGCPVFVDLRGKFYKITYNIGAGSSFVFALGEQAVQCMSELVKQCFHFIHCE